MGLGLKEPEVLYTPKIDRFLGKGASPKIHGNSLIFVIAEELATQEQGFQELLSSCTAKIRDFTDKRAVTNLFLPNIIYRTTE